MKKVRIIFGKIDVITSESEDENETVVLVSQVDEVIEVDVSLAIVAAKALAEVRRETGKVTSYTIEGLEKHVLISEDSDVAIKTLLEEFAFNNPQRLVDKILIPALKTMEGDYFSQLIAGLHFEEHVYTDLYLKYEVERLMEDEGMTEHEAHQLAEKTLFSKKK